MSSSALPKEKQSAYQRWEMASFDEVPPPQKSTPENPGLADQSAASLVAAHEQARAEGYAIGLAEGHTAGLEEGRNTGHALAEKEAQQLQRLALSFQEEISKANEVISQDMLDLALDIAKAMLQSALLVRPEIVLPIISEAVRYLPSVQQPALLILNPEDAPIVREYMGEELSKAGWRISEDRHIERGGCRVDTASNQIDAAASTRWQRICSALGKNNDWLTA